MCRIRQSECTFTHPRTGTKCRAARTEVLAPCRKVTNGDAAPEKCGFVIIKEWTYELCAMHERINNLGSGSGRSSRGWGRRGGGGRGDVDYSGPVRGNPRSTPQGNLTGRGRGGGSSSGGGGTAGGSSSGGAGGNSSGGGGGGGGTSGEVAAAEAEAEAEAAAEAWAVAAVGARVAAEEAAAAAATSNNNNN
ncbi:hypothetical protein GGR56DRAFT_674842 [Xylariaceae sp. FL0804]|nr:hypothetical protein GGR56DRAFT_674842 [Xylariaceae sp. FL0804]